jgi:hypothetical protein
VDTYAASVAPDNPLTLGKLDLTAGRHVLRFQAVGHHPESKGYLMGIDHVIVKGRNPSDERKEGDVGFASARVPGVGLKSGVGWWQHRSVQRHIACARRWAQGKLQPPPELPKPHVA